FQRGLARVSVRARDASKLRFAQLRGSKQGTLDHLPPRLESAQVMLRKCFAGEVNRRDGELRGIECAQIFREQPDFLELGRCRSNRSTHLGERAKFRIDYYRRFRHRRKGGRAERSESLLELVVAAHRTRFNASI